MSRVNLHFTMEYREADQSAISNWEGPGWYVHAPDPKADGHLWAIEPKLISAARAYQIARAIDGVMPWNKLGELVRWQNDEVAKRLTAKVARLEATIADLEQAKAELAAWKAQGQNTLMT